MKKLALMLLLVLFVTGSVFAEFRDDDGQLGLNWLAPLNFPQYVVEYQVHYDINGVTDSIVTSVPASTLVDSSVVLTNLSDFCVARIRAVFGFPNTSDLDTSIFVGTDTALYLPGTIVNPPTAPGWE